MRRDTWFKCDPTAFLGGIGTLEDPIDMLVYTVTLMLIYQAGEPVLNDPTWIGSHAKLSRTRTERTIRRLVEKGKLDLVGGRLANSRAAVELERRRDLSTTRSTVGKTGGRPPKTDPKPTGNAPTSDRNSPEVGEKSNRTRNVSDGETAENGQRGKANGSYARVDRQERREESPPTPHELERDQDGQMPASDLPLGADERAELARSVAAVAERPEIPDGMVARLTGEIMRRARMTAPPIDLVLVESWLANGIAEDLILEAVTRMTGGAKSSVRAFRYFDAEIRRLHDAKASSEDAEVAEFRRIAARAKEP